MATNKVYCSYQEVVDLHTESDRVTVIGVHTPVGDVPSKMFKGFFEQFKKMKYLGCNIKMVPAARLPADPLQVSYAAGEPTIDPRDMMNPIMFHGCHGDDMGVILNRLYGDDAGISGSLDGIDYSKVVDPSFATVVEASMADQLERIYYKALTDRTWKKAHPQRGFQKNGLRPLIYNLAATRQIGFGSDAQLNAADMYFNENGMLGLAGGDPTSDADFDGTDKSFSSKLSKTNVNLITPRLTSLGWIDTRNVITTAHLGSWEETDMSDLPTAIEQNAPTMVNYAEFPKIFMGVILLPPAYKTEQYFRMIINHHFAFAGFRGISFQPEELNVPAYWNKNGDAELLDPDDGQFPVIDPPEGA